MTKVHSFHDLPDVSYHFLFAQATGKESHMLEQSLIHIVEFNVEFVLELERLGDVYKVFVFQTLNKRKNRQFG